MFGMFFMLRNRYRGCHAFCHQKILTWTTEAGLCNWLSLPTSSTDSIQSVFPEMVDCWSKGEMGRKRNQPDPPDSDSIALTTPLTSQILDFHQMWGSPCFLFPVPCSHCASGSVSSVNQPFSGFILGKMSELWQIKLPVIRRCSY